MALYNESGYNPRDVYTFPIKRLQTYGKDVSALFRSSAEKYKSKYKEDDLRHFTFHNLFTNANSVYVIAVLMELYTENTQWWQENKGIYFANDFENYVVKALNLQLKTFVKYGHFHSSFMMMEECLRKLVNVIDPLACNEGTSELKSIYGWLLKKTSNQSYEPFLDVCREIRNSIHNNGTYNNGKRPSQTIRYDNRIYQFSNGKMISASDYGFFDWWEMTLYFYQNINAMLNEIIDSSPVSSIKEIPFR